jgi:adrenodoxin-NADP+ reductase
LKDNYSAVVIAHGASKDRLLGLEHETTAKGILPVRRVVNWYNGSLDNNLDIETEFDITKSRDLTVIGNGNIFCDVSRILMKDPSTLQQFDLPSSVIDVLKNSKIENI